MRKASCRPKASWVNPRCVQRLNVWVGVSWNGPSKFISFTTNLDSKRYSIIIKYYLKPLIDNYPGECILFRDNDSKNSSRTCGRTLEENNNTLIKIPAYSPDINIIENVWGDIRRFIPTKYCETLKDLRKRDPHPVDENSEISSDTTEDTEIQAAKKCRKQKNAPNGSKAAYSSNRDKSDSSQKKYGFRAYKFSLV
ncbi:unnamed protein product [Brachionus calyciflorus]|uniref:Tc1-like transposase DDE domain-containing protein n=1 Tax=Brachionus calyciflorus TaxID=104777 RepID=A0A814GRT8_9BILA|nr:unnamed protein product [Brachionus calyciflorus]